jgi:hypothetical protein
MPGMKEVPWAVYLSEAAVGALVAAGIPTNEILKGRKRNIGFGSCYAPVTYSFYRPTHPADLSRLGFVAQQRPRCPAKEDSRATEVQFPDGARR